ncbi:MAG: phosphatidylglycerophosphatase A [Lysobacterales bacterium 14-68-21]|jgi:phosphatidylglycerophosphatase A|nr:MAG: phosphatidylglycerophosphatase A [Xanthomonadales bacterium 15-68-25]OZB68065.1 MAG: phosphatidylglycerophosphatase A [Xanthomonadales bacterium 14-68-21]
MIAADRKTLTPVQRRQLITSPAGWIACGFGSGLVPKAQGTAGSLVAILPWLWMRHLPLPTYALVVAIVFVIGIWACQVAGRQLGVDDHRALVIDEFVGQWIALVPAVLAPWWTVLAGFVLFRLFDVGKPWPIAWLDRRLKGGLGVMVDDVVAGIFAAVALGLLARTIGVPLPWR